MEIIGVMKEILKLMHVIVDKMEKNCKKTQKASNKFNFEFGFLALINKLIKSKRV
jgi:hypothetical protein